nr:hypothetical protein [Leisingera sp.]
MHGINRPEAQIPGQFPLRFADCILKPVDGAEKVKHRRIDLAAFLGQVKPAAAAFAQPHAKPLLKMPHVR